MLFTAKEQLGRLSLSVLGDYYSPEVEFMLTLAAYHRVLNE